MESIASFGRGAGRLTLWAGAVVLAGCSVFPRLATEQQAITRLTGLNEAQVQACMGPPGTARPQGNGQSVWTYTPSYSAMSPPRVLTDPSQASMSYAAFSGAVPNGPFSAAVAPPSPASCMVVLTFDQGRAINVIYTGPTGGTPPNWQACGAIVAPCMP